MKHILLGYPAAAAALRQSIAATARIDVAADLATCLERFRRRPYAVTLVDLDWLCAGAGASPFAQCQEALAAFFRLRAEADIVVLAAPERTREAVAAVRAGAADFLTLPLQDAELQLVLSLLEHNARLQEQRQSLQQAPWKDDWLQVQATPRSPAMREAVRKARLVAQTRTTVLLTGETGTGKSMLARLIHQVSNRREHPFVTVHCGAIPDALIESELFGHERGAFTGADRRRLGKFEVAQTGTIFLDEVGTLSPSAQIKVLQVLQERQMQRLGGREDIDVDVRIIAATNVSLADLHDRGLFRRDLYYRLNVFPIELPPLRERTQDIPDLVQVFLGRLNRQNVKTIQRLDAEVLDALQAYDWPGNVRELENLIERAFILETKPALSLDSFPAELAARGSGTVLQRDLDLDLTLAEARETAVRAVEDAYLRRQLQRFRGRVDHTAAAAGITPRQLHKLMQRHGIDKREFKRREDAGDHA